MTIANEQTAVVTYVGNGVSTQFSFPFRIFEASDLVVSLFHVTTGVRTAQVLGTHYTLSGVGLNSGVVATFSTPPSSSYKVDLRSAIPMIQETSIKNQGSFLPELHEDAFDRQVRISHQLGLAVGQCLRVDPFEAALAVLPPVSARKSKFLFFNATTGAPEPATFDSNGTVLSASVIGQLLWPITDAESVDAAWPPGHVKRYGIVEDGVTNNTIPIQNAIKAGGRDGHGVFGFKEGLTYVTSNITMYGSTTTIPTFFDGGRAKFVAVAGTTGYLFDVKTPQSGNSHGFRLENAIMDGADICVPLRIYGSQRAIYGNLLLQNSSAEGLRLEHESGGNGGIYYNLFYSILSGASSNSNAGDGFLGVANSAPSNTMQDNTFLNCQAQFNLGDGWDIEYGSGAWVGCGSEKNNGAGYRFENMAEVTLTGGFTENNDRGMAGGGAADGTTDVSFYIGDGCNGIKIIGGRHIGENQGTSLFAVGNFFLPGNFVQTPNIILDERERLRIRSLLLMPRSFAIASIAKGATTTVTLTLNHNLVTGDIMRFDFTEVDDWQTNLDGVSTAITVTGEKTFTIAIDSTSYGDYTTGGTCKNGAGIGFDGATPPQGGINGAEGWELQAGGSQILRFNATCASDETGLFLRHNAGGGGVVVERVTVGAADSGGAGYRVMRVPN